MITIIEGADGTGKSTHAAWLAEQQGARLIHAGVPTHSDWHEEYVLPLIPGHLDGLDFVLDRWHLGELIWPHVFNRPGLFDREGTFELCNHMLAEMGAEIIIVHRKPEAIASTLMLRGEQDQIDDVLKAQVMFLDLADKITGIPVRVVDSNDLQREVSSAS